MRLYRNLDKRFKHPHSIDYKEDGKLKTGRVFTAHATGITFQHPSLTNRQFLRCLKEWTPEIEAEVQAIPTQVVKSTGELKTPYVDELNTHGNRKVFARAAVESWSLDCEPVDVSGWSRVSFNPTQGDRYFHVDGERVDYASEAYFDSDGNMWIR